MSTLSFRVPAVQAAAALTRPSARRRLCVSMSASGFLGIYNVGALSCLARYWPKALASASLCGASAGAIVAVAHACGVSLQVRGASYSPPPDVVPLVRSYRVAMD